MAARSMRARVEVAYWSRRRPPGGGGTGLAVGTKPDTEIYPSTERGRRPVGVPRLSPPPPLHPYHRDTEASPMGWDAAGWDARPSLSPLPSRPSGGPMACPPPPAPCPPPPPGAWVTAVIGVLGGGVHPQEVLHCEEGPGELLDVAEWSGA